MDVLIVGAGMMGRAIAYDLGRFSHFDSITLGECDTETRDAAATFLKKSHVEVIPLNVEKTAEVQQQFQGVDVVVSAVPYRYNERLTQLAIDTRTHFIDLGGNNTIVAHQRRLHAQAVRNKVTVIPDSGLAPGLVSIITRDVVDHLDTVDVVNLRVGGLPRHPQPPLMYQIVFSPYGLINEYVEDALVLDNGKILQRKSLTELESLHFPEPFGTMEAFLTSGGCSTLPYTYQKTIRYLDYKTVRYPGHCEKMKALLDLGLAETTPLTVKDCSVSPRDVFASLLCKYVPTTGEDVVLLKVLSQGTKARKPCVREYLLIDYCDMERGMTAMMRTTGYPVAITAQMIEEGSIQECGVFCPEEIINPAVFFKELQKRDITLTISERMG
ncbi:MAG: saccharopine dehydrogenase NADP-binding domain-containing protein [Candidatus Thermoplasmatota archaeon]|nr:saccharopine dehydrogenase NADP-binding domain-containing protein [Candidatus Thermoplasmatota archaeon]